MDEIWKWMPGYEGVYEVSNLGRVKRKLRLLQTKQVGNYYYAYLTKDGKGRQVNLLDALNSCFEEHALSHLNADIDTEIEWRPVLGFEGAYEVSEDGQVRTVERIRKSKGDGTAIVRTKLRVLCDDDDGYLIVSLYNAGVKTTRAVHRLVAEAFVPNPDGLPQVNHIDGNKHNNSATNLEWVTNLQNIRHSIDMGLRDYSKISSVRYIIQDINSGEIFNSLDALRQRVNVSQYQIQKCVHPLTEKFELCGNKYVVINYDKLVRLFDEK